MDVVEKGETASSVDEAFLPPNWVVGMRACFSHVAV